MASRPPDPGDRRPRRWLVPFAIVGVALVAFAVATRPARQPDTEAALTTVPPGLSEVSTELIDLTNPSGAEATTNEWDVVPWPGRINDVLPFNSSMFAFGYNNEGAAAWLSATGSGWRDVPRFERPDNPKSSVDHAVVWNSTVFALGSVGDEVGLWTARSLSHWFYEGTVPEMGDWLPQGLAATDRLLAIAEKEGRYRGWVSDNGRTWTQLEDVSALDDVAVVSLVGIGDWFYAAGHDRNTEQAVIYRTQDGTIWQRTGAPEGGVLSENRGTVVDISGTSRGLVAVGEANDEIKVWTSSDGAIWSRVASNDSVLLGGNVVVELKSIGTTGEALVAIDDEEYRLAEGSQVLTGVGLMRLSDVGETSADIEWVDGSSTSLRLDSQPQAVHLRQTPTSVTAQGPRIVVVGWVGIDSPSTPAVWTSVDGGTSWSIDYLEPGRQGWARAAAIVGANIVVVGGSDREAAQIWRTTWNTKQMEAAGVGLVEAYFDAIERRDIDAVVALLPDELARFQLPSLGGVDLPWWDESTGAVDPVKVADTIRYLEAVNTDIELGECSTRMLLADTDSLRVTCEFNVESDLLALYSNEDYSGSARIVVANEAIQQVQLRTVPSAHMWQTLVTGFGSQSPEEQQMLDDLTTPGVDPTFTAASAAVHLRLTEEFIAGLLRPGATRIVDTTLGTMEWTWLESLPFPVYTVYWISSYEDGFVAIGKGEPERWTERVTLWTSTDGIAWELMGTQPDVTGMWNLQPFRDGLIAQAWEGERSFLAIYDGTEWSELELPRIESAPYFDVRYLATSGDQTLVVTVGWSEGYDAGPDAHQAWLIGPDNVPRQTDMPITFWESDESIGLVGSDEGFMLGTAQYGSPQSMQIWFSQDGYDWEEIAAATSIENAAYIWSLQRHRDTFFVVGEGAETNCSAATDGGSVCEQLVGLWSSPDGTDWDRVFTASGEPVGAYELGSGPLGMVALSAEFNSERPLPRPIYLSDGGSWERAGNLALMHPNAEWWWVSVPAVGADTIVMPGSAFDPSSSADEDTPFLIVGRLIDS